jgi:IS5 family transposase
MSIDISTINYPIKNNLKTIIHVPANHFLLILSESIPWEEYALIAIEDLYKDRKKSGKKLNIRLHLGAFLLQTIFRWTDRELEENLKYYCPARIFCGIKNEQISYDHSAYVKFRNRLSDETASKFNISLLKVANIKGFTGAAFVDVDSTVQEANIEYPADIRMMQSIFRKGVKLLNGLGEAGSSTAKNLLSCFDLKSTERLFKSYFFAKKSNDGFELKVKVFSEAHKISIKMVEAILSIQNKLKDYVLPWNYKRDNEQLTGVAPTLLNQINHFIKHGEVAPNKILSLHASEVKCISKGKAGKPYEFGRKFFIGRLPGNYSFTMTDNNFALEDSDSLEKVLNNFEEIFNKSPDSISGDQAFWSRQNLKACEIKKINEIGICPRGHKNWRIDESKIEEMATRRSKVEPIIGHLKRRGMGKSKMKSDSMTRLDGQRSSLSLNLSRFARDLSDVELKWAG